MQAKKKVTRRERFLGEMEQVVPCAALLEELRPHYYPKADQGPGRPPIALERMLRMYFLQQWFTLADGALEDAIYDSQAFRNFLRIDLGRDTVPDATTLCGFRRWLEDGALGKALFERIEAQLRARVEHPFHVVKNLFGYRKVRYKGLAKNTNQLHVLFGLANLYALRRPLMA